MKPNGQDEGFSGYGGIEDPLLYINTEYGKGWQEDSSKTKTISGVDGFKQQSLGSGDKNNCTLACITRVMKYYSGQGYDGIPTEVEAIYRVVREIGVQHGYDPNKSGILRDLFVYTPFEIGEMAKEAWKAFGYPKGKGVNHYLCKLKTIQDNVKERRPLLFNIAFGDYKGHSITVFGYKTYTKDRDTSKVLIEVYDGWSKTIRYIDWHKFCLQPSNVTEITPPDR